MPKYLCKFSIEGQEQEVEIEANSVHEAIFKSVNHLDLPKDRKRFTIKPLGCKLID